MVDRAMGEAEAPHAAWRERGVQDDGWATYMQEVGRIRRLRPAEELELGRRIAEGDELALRQMVEANLRLVIAIAKRYQHAGIPLPDLVQEGSIGLLRAARKFDYRRGYRFSTYAVWWIRQAVSRAVANQASAIRVPVHIQEGLVQAARERIQDPDAEDLAAPGTVAAEIAGLVRRARRTISLDQAMGDDEDAVLADAVADTDAPSPFEVTSNHLLHERLVGLLRELPERERAIVSLRYGLSGGRPHTYAEVGERIHLTRERVRQLDVLALAKLRQEAAGDDLESFLCS